MSLELLGDDELERSAVVANCRMNRERYLTGSNGYGREIGFGLLEYLKERAAPGTSAAWLDLCCGMGRALIEAAVIAQVEGMDVATVGVDLITARRSTTRSG